MKKCLCLFFALVFILSGFASCKPLKGKLPEEAAPASNALRILVDLDATRYGSGEAGKNAMAELLY